MHSASAPYRPDIDGLRAVAVLAVVAFHAFPQWLPGGYVGVDIFFVISGFLISSQLIAAADGGSLSFSAFYARRIRRIFPALMLVLLTSVVAGWYVLLPNEWLALARHAGASTIFANNFLLWSEAGYFAGPSELKPLLHLWSLGVEEQFYLAWPLIIWWLRRRNVRWSVAIVTLMIISFALNVIVVDEGAADAAFFLPHTRLWQLAAGAWLAALMFEGANPAAAVATRLYRTGGDVHAARVQNMFSVIGIALIVLTTIALSQGVARPDWWSHGGVKSVTTVVHWIGRMLWLSGDAAYPGWKALAPTAGAVLVIAAGPTARSNRALLSIRPMVFIGLISYPLYLWHWPLLSFLQITEQGDVSRPVKVAAIALSFVLATLTYLLVERPIRHGIKARRLVEVTPLAGAMAALGVVMIVALTSNRLTPPARTALNVDTPVPFSSNEALCRQRFPGLGEYCQQFDSELPISIALLGDSHAAHFLPGLGEIAKAAGANVVHLGQTGCPPLLGIERTGVSGDNNCVRVNRAVIDRVATDNAITDVWLSFRGVLATTGVEPNVTAAPTTLFRSLDDGSTNAEAIRGGLRRTATLLQSSGKKVGIFLQVPELAFRVDYCTGRPVSLRYRPERASCAVDRATVMTRHSKYRELIEELRQELHVAVYDPLPSLCDAVACRAVVDGHLLYSDDNHLGVYGSQWVMRQFAFKPAE